MKIGQIFRYARPYDPLPKDIDDLPNYFYYTNSPNRKKALLEAGINPIKKVQAPHNQRRPAILISSSPHKIGSAETPWPDFFDPDNGHVHYYGDNKDPRNDPALANGNKALLEQFQLHTSPNKAMRILASPVIFFQRVKIGCRSKGNVKFQGFGLISRAQLVTQFDRKNKHSFINYVFDFVIFDLLKEQEEFSWSWITDRRDSTLTDSQTLTHAPSSWNKWVKSGSGTLENCRRRVVKLFTYTSNEQKPLSSSREAKVLNSIYLYYAYRKARFEALAAFITSKVIGTEEHTYKQGWITSPSSDGGADFVGRLDIGSDLASVKIVVLGQAKCEKLTVPTGGNHIARTVARLRRGWIGVYVTTSFFSENVQREVLADKYPIILVNGIRIAKEVLNAMYLEGIEDVEAFLEIIDDTYESQITARDPEEILFE